MRKIEVHMFAALSDNYCFLVHEPESGMTAVIDTPEVDAIEKALEETGWKLTHILNTHHHFDHAGGNLDLKERHGCTIVGSRTDRDRIPGIDIEVGDGETYDLGNARVDILDVPGHTSGHIAYHFAESGVAFVGDTVFALGCGRLFEGSPLEMWTSIQKLMALPDDTLIYCAHEYTQANAAFALSVDPDNAALVARAAEIDALRAVGTPTVPTTLATEKATNPFLRPMSDSLRATLGMADTSDVEVFAETRRRKDSF